MNTIELRKSQTLTHANCGGKVEIVAITDRIENLYRCTKCDAQEYKVR